MKLKALITITRPANVLVGSLTTIIGVLTSYRFLLTLSLPRWAPHELGMTLILTTLTYMCLAAAGNVVNDIYDLEVDRVNRPERPLPSGALTLGEAKALTAILVALGLISAALTTPLSAIGPWTLAIAAIFALIGLAYAAKGKVLGLLGNFTVSVSFAFGLFYGALTTHPLIPPVTWVYFFTAASVLQGRESIKGIEDIEGDALRNVQTIARRYGIRVAAITAAIANILGIILFNLPWLANLLGLNWTGPLYAVLLIPGSAAVATSTILVLKSPTKNARKASLADKIGAFLGLVNFVAGAL